MLHGKNLPIEWVPARSMTDEEMVEMIRDYWAAYADACRDRIVAHMKAHTGPFRDDLVKK